MATNKNATIRYQALDKCFRNPGKKYFITDLIAACNEALLDIDPNSSEIKERQVRYDIKFMRDSKGFDAPIDTFREGKKVYYRYSNSSFSINSQPLNEQEAQQLTESLLTLSRFQGLPQFNWIEDVKARLEQTFSLKTEEKIFSFEENRELLGREYIDPLYNAIVNQTVLEISYQPFHKNDKETQIIHPYHLKQYNNRWFLLGFNDAHKKLSNLALDRILSITENNCTYIVNEETDFQDHFFDVIGVTVRENIQPQTIVIKVNDALLPYIESKPLHHTQKKTKRDEQGNAMIELKVQINYELISVLLSFGPGLEVIEPRTLRETLEQKCKAMVQLYTNTAQ